MIYSTSERAPTIRLLAIVVSVLSLTATVSMGQSPSVVADGFNAPMGILVGEAGEIYVTESGSGGADTVNMPSPFTGEMTAYAYGESARVTRVAPDGKTSVIASLPSLFVSPMESVGGARLAMLDGDLYATVGGYGSHPEAPEAFAAVVRVEDGGFSQVAGLVAYENEHNPDGFKHESNPYALVAGPDGHLWATDAAGNTLLQIDPSNGGIELKAVFDGIPSPIPSAHRGGEMKTDPVPTGIVFGEGGDVFVSFLTGIPFVPGSAKVVRVAQDGSVTDYATGLTMLTDLRRGPDGKLYAVSFGRFTEEGPVPNSGALLRIAEGEGSEEIATGLAFPTSLGFNEDGDAYVTVMNSLAESDAGALIKLDGVAPSSTNAY
jgi:sugar lactone lactonase YvrE